MSRSRVALAGGVGAGIALALYLAGSAGASSEEGPGLRLYGNVELRDSQLAFSVAEVLSQILVEEGDRVTSGQVLAALDSRSLVAELAGRRAEAAASAAIVRRLESGSRPQEVRAAAARVAAARARLAGAERARARLEQTTAQGAESQQALDDAVTAADAAAAELARAEEELALARIGPRQEELAEARARLAQARARVSLAEIRLDKATLRAPTAGVIRQRLLEPGEVAAPERPVLTLTLTNPKWVRAYVSEPQLERVKLGQAAEVESDGSPGAPLPGWVGFVSPEAEFTPKSVETEDLRPALVYEVRVFVHDEEDRLRLGMPVSVRVLAHRRALLEGTE